MCNGTSGDPYAAADVVFRDWSQALFQQEATVAMDPCVRRDDGWIEVTYSAGSSMALYCAGLRLDIAALIPVTYCFTAAKPAMHAPLTEDDRLTPDNDPTPAPFGAFAPNAAQAAIISMAHGSRLKRGAFRPWLSRLVNLLRAGPVDVHYQGASFRFYHQASATERGALFNPAYNIEELNFLRAHVPAGGVFVDVGANVGTYALALARHVGTDGQVIAVEPHPGTTARLAFNNTASGYGQVRLVAAAAGPDDGELLIETDGENL